ncbi:GntR family transcriptional regulator [Nocardioides panaciterrulae]|uniref:GntR family transcriptional repressor for pyruvate dehydrogenase complex n=1 Tax=Nocardioides panaciterrulae TaxID=661492 RepID=A0A7Y9E969_9ACTN|nr:GntR family transcriptional repressor for pyruvate dehydrogenase complex [Nocardioides panaciterrulae]
MASSIAEQILGQITNGSIPVGARLPSEEALAREFEVSRPTVREALAALQFAGHVESRRGSGTVVISNEAAPRDLERPPLGSLAEAVDLLETRILIEPQALAAAASDPDRKALRAARELIGGMHLAVDDPELHATTDIRVHRALLAVCRNTFLRDAATDLLDLAIDPMMLTARTQAWGSSELPHRWADQHEVVCVAIANGDRRGARVGSLAHLASVVENLAAATSETPELSRRMDALFAQLAEAGVTGVGSGQLADDTDERSSR